MPLLRLELQFSSAGVECKPALAEVATVLLEQFDGMAGGYTDLPDHLAGAINIKAPAPKLTVDGWAGEPAYAAARRALAGCQQRKPNVQLLQKFDQNVANTRAGSASPRR